MERIHMTRSTINGSQIILEPEDWSPEEWATILKIFGMKEAERIELADYYIRVYGKKAETPNA